MSRKDITDAMVVRACSDFHNRDSDAAPWELLMQRTGEPEKVVYAAMERAYDRGLIECGVSVRTAWPTAEGRQLLLPPREP